VSKIIVFPCCAGKGKRYWEYKGQKVEFVADPRQCGESSGFLYCRPDDINTDTGKKWREELEEYNQQYQRTAMNPLGLCRAWELYQPKQYKTIYAQLYTNFKERFFILSAGWGLVRADYLLPHYDITLKKSAPVCNRRTQQIHFYDFNHLAQSIQQEDVVLFPGLKDYINLFHELTKGLPFGGKIIYGNKKYGFRTFSTHTGWQYVWARHLISGRLNP